MKARHATKARRPVVESLETREVLSLSPLVQADILILQRDQQLAHAAIQQELAVVKSDITAIQQQSRAAMSTVQANIKADQLTLLQDQHPNTFPGGDPTAVAADKAAIQTERNNLNSIKALEKSTVNTENGYVKSLNNLSKKYDGTVKSNIQSVKKTNPDTTTVTGISQGILTNYTNQATTIGNNEQTTYSNFNTKLGNYTA